MNCLAPPLSVGLAEGVRRSTPVRMRGSAACMRTNTYMFRGIFSFWTPLSQQLRQDGGIDGLGQVVIETRLLGAALILF